MNMQWIYWGKLYDTKFQARVLQQRLEHDAWLYGYSTPHDIEIYRSRRGKYGVRFVL